MISDQSNIKMKLRLSTSAAAVLLGAFSGTVSAAVSLFLHCLHIFVLATAVPFYADMMLTHHVCVSRLLFYS